MRARGRAGVMKAHLVRQTGTVWRQAVRSAFRQSPRSEKRANGERRWQQRCVHCSRNLFLISRNGPQQDEAGDRNREDTSRASFTGFVGGQERHLLARRARLKTFSTEIDATVGSQQSDEFFMRLAVEEARKADRKGEVPVGAVLVCEDGNVIARAHNVVETSTDPTAHAELLCLRQASEKLQSWRLLGVSMQMMFLPHQCFTFSVAL